MQTCDFTNARKELYEIFDNVEKLHYLEQVTATGKEHAEAIKKQKQLLRYQMMLLNQDFYSILEESEDERRSVDFWQKCVLAHRQESKKGFFDKKSVKA